MVEEPLSHSIIGRAQQSGVIQLGVHDIRDYAGDRYRNVDDGPYGGGAGMVLRVDIVATALRDVRREGGRVLLTSPAGSPMTQADCVRWSSYDQLVIVTGHYEGIDARIESLVDEQVSLGDFVLTGGEIAAVAIVDAVGRLRKGVLGNEDSSQDESFSKGLLEYPHYTRPRVWEDQEVPEVLLSGHHARIRAWRHEQSILRTKVRRPDLYTAWRRSVDDAVSND